MRRLPPIALPPDGFSSPIPGRTSWRTIFHVCSASPITRYTVTDPTELRKLFTKVRRHSYALNDQEFITGSTGIAAPVWNNEGEVVAALNLGTLTIRFLEKRELLILMVREAAFQLSCAIGCRSRARGCLYALVFGDTQARRAGRWSKQGHLTGRHMVVMTQGSGTAPRTPWPPRRDGVPCGEGS